MAETNVHAPATPEPESVRSQPKGEKLFDLHPGKGLRLASGDDICRSAFTTLVLFAGTAKCGKTTLLASLLLLFQRGPFAGYLFAGSRTLVGFEERNYHVEVVSRLDKPTQLRTIITELLHLRVRAADLGAPIRDLLLCDMSGEDFREAKDSLDACKNLGIIRRAECFVLLIDGAKLADFSSRNTAKNDALTLLRSCIDAGMLDNSSIVDVLITKWDLIKGHSSKAEIEDFAKHVEDTIVRSYGPRLGKVKVYRVAAHPHDLDMPLGFGLEKVFQSWIDRPLMPVVSPPNIEMKAAATEFDRFLWRAYPAGLKGMR